MRFLLDDGNASYRQLVEKLYQNIDVDVKNLMEAVDFDEVIARAGANSEVLPDNIDFKKIVNPAQQVATDAAPQTMLRSQVAWAQYGGFRNYAIFADGRVVMTKSTKRDFDARQEQLRIQLA